MTQMTLGFRQRQRGTGEALVLDTHLADGACMRACGLMCRAKSGQVDKRHS
jgi:hypothetical protein